MRAGPLSNHKVIAELEQNFVNSWILIRDIRALAKDESVDADVRRIAKDVFKRSIYPVDIQVIDADGKMLSQGSVNRDLLRTRRPAQRYLEILSEGRGKFDAR